MSPFVDRNCVLYYTISQAYPASPCTAASKLPVIRMAIVIACALAWSSCHCHAAILVCAGVATARCCPSRPSPLRLMYFCTCNTSRPNHPGQASVVMLTFSRCGAETLSRVLSQLRCNPESRDLSGLPMLRNVYTEMYNIHRPLLPISMGVQRLSQASGCAPGQALAP